MKYDTLWYPQDTATRLIETPYITISCKARCILHSVSNCEYDVPSSRNFFFNRLGLINNSLAIRANVHSWAILLLMTVQTRVRMFGCNTFRSNGINCVSSRKTDNNAKINALLRSISAYRRFLFCDSCATSWKTGISLVQWWTSNEGTFYVHEVLMPPPWASGEIMKACLLKLIRNSQHTYPLEFGLHPQKPDHRH